MISTASLEAQTVKESACNAGDPGFITESGISLGEGNSIPLQYFCLGIPMDGRVQRATVRCRVTKEWDTTER